MVPCSEFDNVAEQLHQVVAFMQRKFGMTINGAGLSQPQPPPPPHEQQQPPQVDPADPPRQQDNVDRDMQEWLTRDEQLGDIMCYGEPITGVTGSEGHDKITNGIETD
ncbi:hypothetical protein Syun_011798 [Stephania yunnanensis]|uniref:Uncharacterized protein n=1 Tax=Stephania yunnanensis TaxID=152371 RepID=A0AAP0JZG1_9MAGN